MDGKCVHRVAVVCDDRPQFRDSVVRLLMACGFEVPAATDDFGAVEPLVRTHSACLAVVALPLTGMSGLLAVSALAAAVPDCELVLVSPSTTLQPAALEAGARALVPEADLRVLRDLLRDSTAAPGSPRLPRARGQAGESGSVRRKPSA